MLALIHGNHGKKPWNRIADDLKLQVIGLLETKYPDFNLTHFREKLIDHNNLIEKIADLLWKWFREKKQIDGKSTPYLSITKGFRPTTYNENTEAHMVRSENKPV